MSAPRPLIVGSRPPELFLPILEAAQAEAGFVLPAVWRDAIVALIREEIRADHYADLIMQGHRPDQARRYADSTADDHRRVRGGEMPPFNRGCGE